VPVPAQESKRTCTCVLGVSILHLFLRFNRIRFWNCSRSVVFVGTVSTVWYLLELFPQCGICWNCSHSVVFVGTVPTVWYFLELFPQCAIFWNCSHSVLFFFPILLLQHGQLRAAVMILLSNIHTGQKKLRIIFYKLFYS
jgi:hypothetical protein